MKLIIDIGHPAHINFFKHTIEKLSVTNEIYITYLNRGAVPKIIAREFKQYKTFQIGKHKGSKFSIIFDANIFRFFRMLIFIINNRIDAGINGGFPVGLALRLTGRKYIQFDDDYERKLVVWLEKKLAHKLFFPMIVPDDLRINKFNALKEWAYLSPKYFTQDINILKPFDLKSKEYIFIREVSNKTLNYMDQPSGIVLQMAKQISNLGLRVLLSLEDKNQQYLYPPDWTILEEPLQDIHSLIYYSRILISSGDSMAREGAMLGVPSIYCGNREMLANQVLINEQMLVFLNGKDISTVLQQILRNETTFSEQVQFRDYLFRKWEDITALIVNEVEQLKNETK